MEKITLIISIIVVGVVAIRFQSLQKWLLWGVSEAENYLGSGTGQLKLVYAYDLAIAKFPVLTKLIPFSVFAWLVDRTLDQLRILIAENEAIANILDVNQIK